MKKKNKERWVVQQVTEDSRTQPSFPTSILPWGSWRRNKQREEEVCFCSTFYIKVNANSLRFV